MNRRTRVGVTCQTARTVREMTAGHVHLTISSHTQSTSGGDDFEMSTGICQNPHVLICKNFNFMNTNVNLIIRIGDWQIINRSGCEQDLSRDRSKHSPRLRSSESSLNLSRLRHSPEHIYQSIGSDLGLSRAPAASDNHKSLSDNIGAKNENHDSGRSVSPPPRRFFSREGSAESSGQMEWSNKSK